MEKDIIITPHEPDEELLTAKDAIADSEKLHKLIVKRRERIKKARERLRQYGLILLEDTEQIAVK